VSRLKLLQNSNGPGLSDLIDAADGKEKNKRILSIMDPLLFMRRRDLLL